MYKNVKNFNRIVLIYKQMCLHVNFAIDCLSFFSETFFQCYISYE